MRQFSVHWGPFWWVVTGLVLGAVGWATLSVATFQTQQTASASSLSGSVTITFTHQPMNPAYAVFFVWVLAIPFVLLFVPWKYYLTTLAAPTFVAMSAVVQMVDNQFVAGIVLASATWVVVGDALVFVGCIAEAVGIMAERTRRRKAAKSFAARNHPIRVVATPPR